MKVDHCSGCGEPGHNVRSCGRKPFYTARPEIRKAQRAARKAAGLCRCCEAPCAPGSLLYCPPHLEKQRAFLRRYRESLA